MNTHKNIKNQSGSMHTLIITIVLIVVIAGGVGFAFYQNFIAHKSTDSAQNKEASAEKKSTSPSPSTSMQPIDNTKYFAVDSLGVKFNVPEALKNTTISFITPGAGPGTALTTDRMKSDKGCGQFINVTLYRDSKYAAHGTVGYDLLNTAPIGGYYYSSPHPSPDENIAACADASAVSKDAANLWDMLKTIKAI